MTAVLLETQGLNKGFGVGIVVGPSLILGFLPGVFGGQCSVAVSPVAAGSLSVADVFCLLLLLLLLPLIMLLLITMLLLCSFAFLLSPSQPLLILS